MTKKAKVSFFRPTVQLDHAASRLVKSQPNRIELAIRPDVNQRSMDGERDTEIAIGACQLTTPEQGTVKQASHFPTTIYNWRSFKYRA